MKKLILLVAIFIFIIGCQKDKIIVYSSSLFGEWSWFITCGGVVGCVTPESEHIYESIYFNADSTFSRFQNDSLISSGKFSTFKLLSDDGTNVWSIVKMKDAINIYSIHSDTLSLSALTINIGSAYKRLK